MSPIPGEARKFSRRRIVAVVLACRRERERAVSQEVTVEAVSCTGVRVSSLTGVSVGGGRGVGDGVSSALAVGDGTGSVAAGAVVCVGDGSALDVDVCEGDEEVARTATGFAARVTEAVAETASAGEDLVGAADNGGEAGLRSSKKKRTNRRIATINLKRS